MAQLGPVAGVARIEVDGKRVLQLRGSLNIQGFTLEKTGVAGQDGPHGYKEMPVIPFIEGEFSNFPGFSLTTLQNYKNVTVTALLDGLHTYVLSGAFVSGTADLDASEGKLKIKFEGLDIQEI